VPRAFLIDTDTASDDAVALIMALRAPDVEVRAITIVAGNVPVAQAARNALYTAELCGSDVPVYPGADHPLLREYVHAEWFHGKDGLGDHNYPAPRRAPEPTHAVEAIVETVRANPGITLVTLGPLTNVALALARAPDIAANVARTVVMGGAPCCEGNVTPAAEYNMWVDPEAARMVVRSGLPIELVGWHLCRGAAALDPADLERVLSMARRWPVSPSNAIAQLWRPIACKLARPAFHCPTRWPCRSRSIQPYALRRAPTIWKSKPPAI
jgi:purine nucleosidase